MIPLENIDIVPLVMIIALNQGVYIELLLTSILTISILAIVHVFITYPLSLPLLSMFTPASQPSRENLPIVPSVELIIAAYNEEDVIGDKIKNSLSLEYPNDKITITVFSDASTDRTDQIVKSYSDSEVRLRRIEGRVGKTGCQNITVAESEADIIVFSDADSMYKSDAIKNLISKFKPGVGCVVGELRYRKEGRIESEYVYRVYERFIKRWEAQVGSVVGGNGSIYAVRRSSYVGLPEDAISDFAEPLEIVKLGERVEYAKEAIAIENTWSTVNEEQLRRERIVVRAWNTLAKNKSLLSPRKYPLFCYQLWSHTALRWLTPLFLFLILSANGILAWIDFSQFGILLFAQIIFYLVAGAGFLLDRSDLGVPKLIQVPYYFVSLNLGLLNSLLAFIQGTNIRTWENIKR